MKSNNKTSKTSNNKTSQAPASTGPDHEVVVIGTGMAGIAVGVKLLEAGMRDFVMLDRMAAPGGVWQNHTYPGVGVDTPAVAYDYSFSRNSQWSRVWVDGAEINANHMRVAAEHGLAPHFRLNTNIVRQAWDEANGMWRLETADDRVITARFLIAATGQFPEQKPPAIPGVEEFKGKLQQSAHWDRNHDHTGERVAIIGTGASAVQIVPTMAPTVAQLDVFQRTPVFCFPKENPKIPPRVAEALATPRAGRIYYRTYNLVADALVASLALLPGPLFRPIMRSVDSRARALNRRGLQRMVHDETTRTALTPNYGMMVKRPTASSDYLRAFNRDNVGLITTAIDRITDKGIRTVDGIEHEYDTIVLATGHILFSDPEYYQPGTVIGRNGFDLGTFYREHGVQAYEGMAVPGLPNRWMMSGPYSFSLTPHIPVEVYAESIVSTIMATKRAGGTVVEVDQHAHEKYHAKVRRRARNLEWYMLEENKGVTTYYTNSHNHLAALRLTSLTALAARSRRAPLANYRVDTP